MTQPHAVHVDNTLETYRYLRLGMIVLAVALGFSVVTQWWTDGADCWLTSVSAYYFTPSRNIFVGALVATGVGMIIYQGNNTTEDVVLNFAGFMSCIVGVVPCTPDPICGLSTHVPSATDRADAVFNNALTVLVIAVAAVGARLLARWRTGSDLAELPPQSRIAGAIALALGIAGTLYFAIARDQIERYGHYVAAAVLFVGFGAVVMLNAWSFGRAHNEPGQSSSTYANRYGAVAAAMIASVVLVFGVKFLVPGWNHWLLTLEALIIVEFAVFWLLQTRELWNTTHREGDPLARAASPR